uniref:TRAP transporter substrate-binding protein n=1 Tax=Polaromonas sp. AET17H-212 TaxID=1977061 RepID=UPI001596F125
YYDTAYFKLLVGELPFALPGAAVGAKVMTEFVEKHGKDVFDKLGVKNMGMAVTDPYVLFSSKPIRKFDDMKGVRLRAAGKAWVPIAQAWGAVATPMQPEEAYTALERGTLGAMHYSLGSAVGWKYFEVAPYVTLINSPTVVINMIMNKVFFEKLPADLKTLFEEELNPALLTMMAETYERSVPDAMEKMSAYFKAKGKGEVITLAPEEKAKFIAPAKQAWEDWVKEANKRGLPGEALLADYKAIMKKNAIGVCRPSREGRGGRHGHGDGRSGGRRYPQTRRPSHGGEM